MDREGLADFLRRRREALQPEDVGMVRGPRRRTSGLRREEVAALCGMSSDYYSRLERQRGPQPSEQMLAAIARGLRLTLAERDHLFRLAGHSAPQRAVRGDHVNPGIMRVLDRLCDTPALVTTALGETLRQTPAERRLYLEDDHPLYGRVFTSLLREAATREGPRSRAAALTRDLLGRSPEFAALWDRHEVGLGHPDTKRLVHSELGVLELQCQTLLDPDQSQALLVYTATPGTESHDKLRLLAVIGSQHLGA
ncbi:helix-turn-helix transcriptional regulator [Microbispora bryophytorum]|uniref:helix-turn-helix transcriptional regulator n=1 Tax=Microbispora bryophytorum TaxID=1460882 RepID=UPI0033E94FA5